MSLATQEVSAKGPVRCLVVQLARLGDTLQSLMALRAAKQLYPQLEIHFVARDKFASAAKKVPWIHNVITLPTDQLLTPVMSGKKSETEALGDLARWIGPIIKDPWDLVVNWSYSEASSYLTALLPARVKLGYTRRRDSSFSGADGWSHYIQAIIQGSVRQNIHLTDILTTQLLTALQIHIGDPGSDGNAAVTSKSFFSLTLDESRLARTLRDPYKKWISIQLGAGNDSKTWEPEKWAKLAANILTHNPEYGIFLLGGKEDLGRLNSFMNFISNENIKMDSIVSLVGETDFDLWASTVSRSQWLLAGDTAAIHLASVLGTRILNISVGPVRFAETGPYGNGHYVVSASSECPACLDSQGEHECKRNITPEAAYIVWSYASQEWAHSRQVTLEAHAGHMKRLLETVSVYRSKIRGSQDGGGVVYEPLQSKSLRLEEWLSMVMGYMARSWYCGWVPAMGKELVRSTISPSLIQKLRQLHEATEVLSKVCIEARAIASTLNRKSSVLKSDRLMGIKDKEELQELGRNLLELESLIDRVGKAQPPLAAFSYMAKVLMHNLKGSQISDLGKEAADSYRQLGEGVIIYKEWINYTLNLAKPVALKVATVASLDTNGRPPERDL